MLKELQEEPERRQEQSNGREKGCEMPCNQL